MADSLIRPIAVNVNTGALTYTGSLTTSEITDATLTAADLAAPILGGYLASGSYYVTAGQQSTATSIPSTNSLRVVPWFVPNSVTLSRIGAEITTAGDSGSKLRLGIYADSGAGYPGALVLDAGTIAGDSNTVQEITISQALTPGLYWLGGAAQVISVTGPTVRIVSGNITYPNISFGTSAPASNATTCGFLQASVSGALPGTFTASISVTTTAPRIFVKVA